MKGNDNQCPKGIKARNFELENVAFEVHNDASNTVILNKIFLVIDSLPSIGLKSKIF